LVDLAAAEILAVAAQAEAGKTVTREMIRISYDVKEILWAEAD